MKLTLRSSDSPIGGTVVIEEIANVLEDDTVMIFDS